MPLPTVILPGFFASAQEYQQFEKDLNHQGIEAVVVPLRKRNWIPTLGGRSVVPIIRALDRTVKQVLQQHNTPQINLIGHSAGGWIARIYLGEIPYTIHNDVSAVEGAWKAHQQVATLITLGTPHVSQEKWTQRNLDFVADHYPGAFHNNVRYICVAGKAVYGDKRQGSWLAYNSYKLTVGEGNTWGDGITPIEAAHLDGATNLTLEGVMHSPRSPWIWYGSEMPRQAWIPYLA